MRLCRVSPVLLFLSDLVEGSCKQDFWSPYLPSRSPKRGVPPSPACLAFGRSRAHLAFGIPPRALELSHGRANGPNASKSRAIAERTAKSSADCARRSSRARECRAQRAACGSPVSSKKKDEPCASVDGWAAENGGTGAGPFLRDRLYGIPPGSEKGRASTRPASFALLR